MLGGLLFFSEISAPKLNLLDRLTMTETNVSQMTHVFVCCMSTTRRSAQRLYDCLAMLTCDPGSAKDKERLHGLQLAAEEIEH
ncbi:hypothetical protein BgiBS90_030474, partial [Biomphalaria glabrata]